MVNRYDNPAQAEFINTYVPIPFEQLYTLGKQAKENVDQALKDYSTALDKWAEFQSPSAADTKAYYDETYGRALPVAEELSKNLDMIKTAEGRSKIYSAINNVDRAKLSMLRQSAEGLRERQKVNQRLMLEGKYNPLWHDVDFTGYNTLTSGIYTIYDIKGHEATVHTTFHTRQWHFPAEKMGQKEDTDKYIVITSILETPKHLFFISLQGLYDKKKPFYGIYDKEKHITYMNDANVGLTDDLTHFMPFYPITCTEEGEYAALLEIGKIDEWMDKNPGIVQEGKLSFLQEINEESNPVCVIVGP